MSLIYILIPIILSFIINIFIFRRKNKTLIKSRNLKYLPPGPIIGIVWIFLLGLLGYIYSLRDKNNESTKNIAYLANNILFIIFNTNG